MKINGKPRKLLECLGIRELYPPQIEAVEKGLLEGKNLLVTTPTASGKTLVAALGIASQVNGGVSKAFYTVPLRSIAFEKKMFFEAVGRCLGYRVETIVGDLEVPEWKLKKADIVVSTYEKMDSIIRKNPDFLTEIGVGVIDELHYISDPKRGPIVELIVSALKYKAPQIQLIGLSATVSNAEEIADWINARLVKTNWRPVPLREGVYRDGFIYYANGKTEPVSQRTGNPTIDLVLQVSSKGGQSIVFVQSRRKAVSLAKKITSKHKHLNYDHKNSLEAAERIKKTSERTELSEILSSLVSKGVSFHHAGLSNQQRTAIEDAFRRQGINVIVATPTLAAGVNLPARYVVVDEYVRYEEGFRTPISVSEYKQLAGRAGRPGYDEVGTAVIVARPSDDPEELIDYYIKRQPEPLHSKLANKRVLRIILLASIASGLARRNKDIDKLVMNTLYAAQTQSRTIISFILKESIKDLAKWNMIVEERGIYQPTRLGLLTSLLYLDPMSSKFITEYLRKRPLKSVFGILHLVSMTEDAQLVRLQRRDIEALYKLIDERYSELIVAPEKFIDDEARYLQAVKTAALLEDWVNETPLKDIESKYNVGPGDVSSIVETSVWLVYSVSRIVALFPETQDLQGFAKRLEERLKYGVKEEVLELTRIRGVGRVRARLLYKYGYKTVADLKKAELEDLVKIPTIGYIVAREILEQLGVHVEGSEEKEKIERHGILSFT
ncbi:MAG: DEAD/DEAH box helicase [Desulfurococcales archaeon]|nr:DEAD/DEAH box helicase [Desulfurococcales archaeon]